MLKDFYDFIVGVLNAVAWPVVVFSAFYLFGDGIRSVLSRLLSGEMLGAKINLESEKDYLEKVNLLESAQDENKKREYRQELIEPKNKQITPDAGAKIVANDLIRKMKSNFIVDDFSDQFDQLFSSDPKQLGQEPLSYFRSMVISKLRESKFVAETNDNGKLRFRKI